jgi:hypothetical protein
MEKIPPDMRKLARQARRQGWTVTMTNKCHWRWEAPDGRVVITSSSPSDYRAAKKVKCQLRLAHH